MHSSRFLVLAAILLASCSSTHRGNPPRAAAAPPPLPRLFDCLRENGLALVSAHRGQAFPDRAENALSSFRESRDLGILVLEIDIARTADGELVLMHDRTLDRTTTGKGLVSETTFEALRKLKLKDGAGRILDEGVPTLDEALVFARRNSAMLQLDIKRGVKVQDVMAAVRANKVENHVAIIAYDLAGTRAAFASSDIAMVSAGAANDREQAAVLAMANPRMLYFTGTTEPDPALIAKLRTRGVEAITATLGREGERLDDRYLADGKGSEYGALAQRGVAMIASDRPVQAWAALLDSDRDGMKCVREIKR